MSKPKVAIAGQGKQEMPKSKLRPVIIINVMNGQGETIDSARLPYNGDTMALTDKISELLEKHQGINDVVVLPTTGYELNQ